MNFLKTLGLAAVGAMGVAAAPAQAVPVMQVDVELQLLIDVSGSVDSTEYAQQVGGYVSAFQSATIQNAIFNQPIGSIATQVIFWSGSSQQAILQSDASTGAANYWFLINDVTSANAFATALDDAIRPFSGQTAPGSALAFGAPLFANDFEGTSLVIDVSGDGAENDGVDTAAASAAAIGAGVDRINGIAIGSDGADALFTFYNTAIRNGTDSFALASADFSTFQTAIAQKLEAEITGGNPTSPVPLPASALLLLGAAGGLGALRLRRKA